MLYSDFVLSSCFCVHAVTQAERTFSLEGWCSLQTLINYCLFYIYNEMMWQWAVSLTYDTPFHPKWLNDSHIFETPYKEWEKEVVERRKTTHIQFHLTNDLIELLTPWGEMLKHPTTLYDRKWKFHIQSGATDNLGRQSAIIQLEFSQNRKVNPSKSFQKSPWDV